MSEENEYTGIIQQESAQELRQSMLESVDKNPDQEAKLQSLAKQYDLPVDAVRFDPGTVEKNAKLDAYDYENLVKNSPATSALVADPQKASIIHDDIHNTAAIEQAVKQFGLDPALKLQPTEFGKNAAKVAGAAVYQTSASLVGLAEAGVTNAKNLLSPILPDGVLPVDVFGQTLKGLQDIRHSQEAWRDYLTPKAETNFGKGVISGGMSLAQNAPLLAAGIYTGNPGLVLDSMAALTFGQTYGEDSDKGVPNSTATLHSVANAGWEKYTEGWSVNKLFGDLKAGSSVIKTMAHQIVPEVAGEQVATAMQGLNDWMVQHPEKPIAEYIQTMPDAAQQTLIATFVGMGGNTALMKGYEALAHPTIKASAANQAAFDIERLNQVAAASKVLNRDPALIHELVTKATDDSPSQHLFMDANTLAQSGVADKVAEAIPDVARQLPDALKTGGEIRVSKADYTTAIAGTELAQQLVDHWRVEGEDFTRAEAQDFLQNHTQELADHVERVMNSRSVDDAFRASAEVVKQNIKQQLEATGRNIDDVNEAYSTLLSSYFAVNAAKLNITPEELHAKYPVNFMSEFQGGYNQNVNSIADSKTDVVNNRWQKALHNLSANSKTYDSVFFDTPSVLKMFGVTGKKIPFPIKVMRQVINKHPDIPMGVLTNLPKLIHDPVFIFNHKDGGVNIAVDAETTAGEPIVVGIREGRIRTITPLHHHEGTNGRTRLNYAFNRSGGLVYVSNEKALAEAKASIPVAGWDNSNGHNVRTKRNIVTREDLVKQYGEDFYQNNVNKIRGSFNPDTLTISLLKDADLSTFLHEIGHFFLESQFKIADALQRKADANGIKSLTDGEQEILKDSQILLKWFKDQNHKKAFEEILKSVESLEAKAKKEPENYAAAAKNAREAYNWAVERGAEGYLEKVAETFGAEVPVEYRLTLIRPYHELFAEGFEKYLAEGKSPSFDLQGVFNKFSAWMLSIYQSLKKMRVTLTPEVRGVMDRMIASKEQIQMAEQGRSMMPLFASKEHAEKLGVHIDNWDEYQSLGRDATNAAVAALQSKAYQDLQWASNARAKSLKRLQRQHDERRKEIKREVTTELMSQPVYRAWQFLTGKLPTADFYKTPSELDHQQAVADWKADKSQAEDDARQRHAEAWKNSYAYQQAEATGDKFKKIELRKNYIDAAVEMDMVNWEAANPRPKAPEKDSTVTDKGEVVYGKINRDDLLALKLPKDMAQKIIKLKMTAEDGFSPDVLANLIPGFTSGADLVNAIGNALPPKEAIDEMTDQRMLAQYGNMATPEGIQKAADEAIYSDIRAKFIAKEFNTLASAIGERKILAQAAKEIADQMIAKLRVRDIRPQQYATAQARAAKNAEKATKAGKTDVAAHEKRNELINVYATKAAYAALDDAEKIVRYLKRVQKPGKIPARHHDQIMSLLSKFSLANETLKSLDNAARFRTWAKGQIDAGNVPPNVILLLTPEQRASYLKELDRRNDDGELIYPHEEDQMLLLAEFIDTIPVRNYKEVSIEELRGLRDTIKQIEHIGRRTEKVLTDRKNRNFADVVETIRANITAVAANQNRVASDTISPTDKKGQQLLSWRGYFFSHIKIANLIHIIDGKEGGPLWEHLMKTANDAGNTEVIELAKAHDDIKALLMPLKAIGDITDKAIPFPTLGRSLNRQERIVMAMNMGNDSNIQRLLGGSGWTLADIQPALDTLTAADWRFVQSMWDYFETYRPRVGAMEEMINGVQPEWIEAKPMTVKTADGQTINLKGGYAPVIYDPRGSGKAASFAAEKDAKAMMQAARVASTVSKSFTKQRVEEVKGRPLMLSLDAMIGGVQDTIHYLNWQPWIIDANRLIKALDPQIRTYYGAEVVKQFRDWAGDNAAGMKPARDAAERLVVSLSRNVSYAGLAFNVVSALKQVTGYTQSIAIIGSKAMAQGVAMSIVNPRKAYLDAVNKSSFMRKRADTRMRDLAETRNTVQDQSMVREMLDKTGYSMMLAMQTLVDVPTWWGAYGKYIDQGQDEAMAIAMADQAVIDAQGSGMQKDLASVERATGAIRLLTGFMSFSNTTLNINYRTLKSDTNIGDKAATLMLVNALPVAMMIAIDQAVSALAGGDGDDEDKMANKMASGFFSSLLSQLVGIRELSQIYNAFAGNPGSDYSGAVGTRLAADTINLAKQVGQGDMDASLRRALINFAGETMRLPAAQINRTITGLEAINDGQTDSPFALAFGFHN